MSLACFSSQPTEPIREKFSTKAFFLYGVQPRQTAFSPSFGQNPINLGRLYLGTLTCVLLHIAFRCIDAQSHIHRVNLWWLFQIRSMPGRSYLPRPAQSSTHVIHLMSWNPVHCLPQVSQSCETLYCVSWYVSASAFVYLYSHMYAYMYVSLSLSLSVSTSVYASVYVFTYPLPIYMSLASRPARKQKLCA